MRHILFFITMLLLFSCSKPQDLQQISEHALREELEQVKAKSGLVILLKDSQVVAKTDLVLIDTIYWEGRQETFSEPMNTGTLLFPVIMMAVLDSISPTDTVDVGNGIYIKNGHRVEDHNANRGGYGVISAEQAIAFDSKIGIMKMAEKHNQMLESNFYRMGFSSLELSPLEIVRFYDRIAHQDTSLCSFKVMKDIRNMLRMVVTSGTGKNLDLENLEISGKTGKTNENEISCCAYFKMEGSIYTCLVIISNPKEGYPSGGMMCGEVIKRIIKDIKEKGFVK